MLDLDNLGDGEFLVNVLGIVFDTKTKKILIGKRENDPYIKELGWCFPGDMPCHEEDLEECLKKKIKEFTEIDVESLGVIFAKSYPENRKIMSVYYLCEIVGGEAKAGGKFVDVKWVDPEELEKYFTTSFHPKLKEYILGLK